MELHSSGLEEEQPAGEEEDDEDCIDIDNPEDLAKRGLVRVQLEGSEDEFLLDQEGNIYTLQGEPVGQMPPEELNQIFENDTSAQQIDNLEDGGF